MQNLHSIKQDICDIGSRIYNRQFAAANDGNITVRVSENEVLCTPTLHCKGYLKPDDIALIDMQGNQISGRKKRSSEALLHLEIYKQREDIKSVVPVIPARHRIRDCPRTHSSMRPPGGRGFFRRRTHHQI